jgi:hypothetical protein
MFINQVFLVRLKHDAEIVETPDYSFQPGVPHKGDDNRNSFFSHLIEKLILYVYAVFHSPTPLLSYLIG